MPTENAQTRFYNNSLNINMLRRATDTFKKFNTITFRSRANLFTQPNFDPAKDYYLTLGVSKDAKDSDIKKAYFNLAKIHHPDHNNGKDTKFK